MDKYQIFSFLDFINRRITAEGELTGLRVRVDFHRMTDEPYQYWAQVRVEQQPAVQLAVTDWPADMIKLGLFLEAACEQWYSRRGVYWPDGYQPGGPDGKGYPDDAIKRVSRGNSEN